MAALIHLHTDKSIISVPLDVPADAEFVLYHGKHFAVAATSANRRMWEERKGEMPEGANVFEDPSSPKTSDLPDALRPRAPEDAVPKPKNVAQATAEAVKAKPAQQPVTEKPVEKPARKAKA